MYTYLFYIMSMMFYFFEITILSELSDFIGAFVRLKGTYSLTFY